MAQSEILNDEAVEAAVKVISDDNSAYDYFDKDSKGFLISTNPDYFSLD